MSGHPSLSLPRLSLSRDVSARPTGAKCVTCPRWRAGWSAQVHLYAFHKSADEDECKIHIMRRAEAAFGAAIPGSPSSLPLPLYDPAPSSLSPPHIAPPPPPLAPSSLLPR